MWERYKINTKIEHEVLSIDRKNKKVVVNDIKKNQIFEEEYDKLILSTGASAIIPNIDGVNSENVFVLKTIPDSQFIKNFIQKNNVKNAVVVGAGFIGMEIAGKLN
jgi:NADPH-dependent 2,4-dienoyl-CoA reductase/sulfur reductase-like enzyme